jgi:FkbM family methyltransferase
MSMVTRVAGGLSRRLGRPELLAAVDASARAAQHDALGIATVLAATLTGEATYIDIGANRGQVLREAVRVAPRGRHIAFEPIPALAGEVALSFPDVECRQLALGAHAEVTEFCHFKQLDGWSGLRRRPEISDERGQPEYITVTVSTLDAEIAQLTPQVIKIDVEGAELAVLEGGRAVLARARPLVIFEHDPGAAALYDTAPGAPWDLLSELGYRIFTVTGQGPFTREEFIAAGDVINWLAAPDVVPGETSALL